jgi:hypothetical protein
MSKDVNAQLIPIDLFFTTTSPIPWGEVEHHGSRKLGTTKGRPGAGRNSKVQMDLNRRAQTHSYLQKGKYMHMNVCELGEVSLSTQALSTQFHLFHPINTKSFIAINCLLTKTIYKRYA